MKVIIAGSRQITDYDTCRLGVSLSRFKITEVVSGCARGVDKLGEIWAHEHGIAVKRFPANWDGLGKRAGYLRNEQMAEYAEALVAIWDGESKGTKHMIDIANKRGLLTFVYEIFGYVPRGPTHPTKARRA